MENKYKYIVFSPYFGKLPSNFNLWLHSCAYNKSFKFIVFTDNKIEVKIPNNVKIVYMSFEEFKNRIQMKFDFRISISTPYKLCDFKPAYGYIFDDYIKECKYWGHCDMDLVFGNIEKFLPNEDFDKISYLGHLCLYKNNKKINKMFMKTPRNTISYIDIFSNDGHFGFDEIGNYCINNIFINNKLKIYNLSIDVADVDCRRERMYIVKYENGKFTCDKSEKIFIFNKGVISSYNIAKRKIDNEYAYVHFQKRKMTNYVQNIDKFIIIHNSFIDYESIDKNYSKLIYNKKYDFKWIKFKYKAIIRRLKRYILLIKIKS